jgi:hypothetical protein
MVPMNSAMALSFGAQLAHIEERIKSSTPWPSPATGLALHLLQLLDGDQLCLPDLVKISFPDGQLDTAPLIAAAGYSLYVMAPNAEQFVRWEEAVLRFSKRDPFPRDRQTFAFRPSELVAFALGISKTNNSHSAMTVWIRSVIELLPNKNPAQDLWASLLHHYAAALTDGVGWPISLPSRFVDYDLPELCLLFVLLHNNKIPQPSEIDNEKLAKTILHRSVSINVDVREPEKLAAMRTGIALALRCELENPSSIASNLASSQLKNSRSLVVLVHGIRTSGRWIRRIKLQLEHEVDCEVEPAGFGFFDVFRFLIPGPTRTRAIDTVKWKLHHAIDRHRDLQLIIVAHSFGTFCITEILKNNPQIKPARLLFCGSIVAQNFRWDALSQMASERRMLVLNECGARDIWPPLAHSVTFGYGSSGTAGFQTPGVEDRCHDLGHSDYFAEDFVKGFWVPFIRNGHVENSKFEEKMPEVPWWISVLGLRPILPWLVWIFVVLVWLVIAQYDAKKDPRLVVFKTASSYGYCAGPNRNVGPYSVALGASDFPKDKKNALIFVISETGGVLNSQQIYVDLWGDCSSDATECRTRVNTSNWTVPELSNRTGGIYLKYDTTELELLTVDGGSGGCDSGGYAINPSYLEITIKRGSP